MNRLLKIAGAGIASVLVVIGMLASVVTQAQSTSECRVQQGSLPSTVPERLNAIFTAAAKTYDVPAYAVALVYYSENGLAYREPPPPYGNGKPWPVSSAGAHGPMQFLLGTWQIFRNSNPAHRPGDINDLTDASYATAHYLAVLGVNGNSSFGDADHPVKGTVVWALGAYNAGAHSGFEHWSYDHYTQEAAKEYDRAFAGKSTILALSAMISVCDGQDTTNNDDSSSFSATCPSDSPASVVTTGNGTKIKVCRVNGMIVNASIADNWYKLVQEAKSQGINLTGGGFRSAAQQIALRKAHCGTSHYAIYQMPAHACTPDTAIPGTSAHERALAVDLNMTQKVYRFMHTYGPKVRIYRTVPSEWWHWEYRP